MPTEMRIVPAGPVRSATQCAAELAAKQFGAVARRQLLAQGCTRSQIAHWLEIGRLFPRYPGVYAWGRSGLGEQGELGAALLYAGHGAALGGLTDLWWLGLLKNRPELIHVDAPGRRGSHADIRISHPQVVERHWHRDLPVSPLPRALLAASSSLGHNTLRLVLARADYEKHLDLPSLQVLLGDGRRGTRALRRAMASHLPELARCVNDLERSFILLCESHSIRIPEPNERIGRYRPDMLWRSQRLIVELDGKAAHSSNAQRAADGDRQRFLEGLGYEVIRFNWAEVNFEQERVAAAVRAALALAA